MSAIIKIKDIKGADSWNRMKEVNRAIKALYDNEDISPDFTTDDYGLWLHYDILEIAQDDFETLIQNVFPEVFAGFEVSLSITF